MVAMKVTVAICTWNRADLLDQTLTRMRELRIPAGVEWELLVVNNNCTDRTDAVIARHASTLPIRRIFEPTPGHSNARNRAINEARSDLIAWTDDDVLVHEDWLGTLVEASYRHPEAAGFGGPIEPWFPVQPDPALVEAFPQLKRGFCGLGYESGEEILPDGKPVVGANMAFRMAAVQGLRFDIAIGALPRTVGRSRGKTTLSLGGGEDDDYVRRLRARGGQILWVPSMRVRHYVDPKRMTLDYLRALYAEYGQLSVRQEGIPAGARVFGVPRWLVRAWIESRVRYALCFAGSNRVEMLTNLRQAVTYQGMIRECRAMRRSN